MRQVPTPTHKQPALRHAGTHPAVSPLVIRLATMGRLGALEAYLEARLRLEQYFAGQRSDEAPTGRQRVPSDEALLAELRRGQGGR